MKKLFGLAAIAIASLLIECAAFAMTQEEIIKLCESGSATEIKAALNSGELTKESLIKYTTEDYDGSKITLTMSPLFIAAMKNPSGEAIKELAQLDQNLLNLAEKSGAELELELLKQKTQNDMWTITGSDGPLSTVTSKLENTGYTPLTIAARCNSSVDAVQALINLGSDVNYATKTTTGFRLDSDPEMVFKNYSFNSVVHDMFFKYTSLTKRDFGKRGPTPLLLAARFNPNPDIVKLLISAGADPDYNIGSITALSWAAAFNENEEVIDALLQNGAKITTAYSDGRKNGKETKTFFQPIIYSMMNPNIEVFKKLISYGAKWDDKDTSSVDGITPLMFASIACSNPEVVSYLISNGADVNERSNEGYTALTFAAQNESCPEVIQILIDAGADMGMVDRYDKTSVFYAAGINTNPEAIEILARNGADLNAKSTYTLDKDGANTPIAYAASFNPSCEVMKALIKNGATVNFRYGTNNATPLMWACARNNADVVKALIDGGAKINIEDKDKNPTLFYAIDLNEDPEVVKALIKGGADIKSPSTKNWYPFQKAACNAKNIYILQALLDAGANPKAVGKNKNPTRTYLDKNHNIRRNIENDDAAKAIYYEILKKIQ